jgi:hypothetical protein
MKEIIMKKHMKRRTERKHSLQPRLEDLESRRCPAVTMSVLEGHILEVLGDRGNNVIELVNNGSQISVMGDGAPTQTFTGIDTIRVNTWTGRDNVRLVIETPPPDPDFSFAVDLGAGDDFFTLLIPTVDSSLPPLDTTVNPSIKVGVQGGAGDDIFQTFVGQLDVPLGTPPPHLGFSLDLDYQGGRGDDTFSTHFVNLDLELPAAQRIDGGEGNDSIGTFVPAVQVNAPLSLEQNGGPGNDDIRVIFGINPQPDQPADQLVPAVQINAALALNVDGGLGDDNIAVICGFNPQPDPPARQFVPAVQVNAPLAFNVNGGLGGDDIRVIFDFNPQPDPPADQFVPAVQINGPLAVMVDGGDGADNLQAGAAWQVNAGASTLVHLIGGRGQDEVAGTWANHIAAGASSEFDLEGGIGNDSIAFNYLDARVDGTFRLNLDGDDGADNIDLQLNDVTVGEVGQMFIQANGGRGNDRLSAELGLAPTRSSSVDTSMDGGAGNDIVAALLEPRFSERADDLHIHLLGGEGNDALAFVVSRAILGADLLVDGGPGMDTGIASPGVQVINCER